MKRRGRREWATVALLPFVWVVGVVLLWRSRAWTRRDKVIGTLVLPGGLAFVVYVPVEGVLLLDEGCAPLLEGCSVAFAIDPVSALVLALLTVLQLASAVYLAIRADLRRST